MGCGTIIYLVEYGDWLAKIAEDHGTTVSAIWNHPLNAEVRARNGSPRYIYPGDVLHIPTALPAPPPAKPPSQPPAPEPPVHPAPPLPKTGDDWPYGPVPPELFHGVPSWSCPQGLCTCDPKKDAQPDLRLHTVFFHDELARRMANARCRVWRHGVLVSAPKNADADGSLKLEVPADTMFVALEWAPQHTPRLPHLPFRRLYRLDMPVGLGDATGQRLHHLGYERPALVASKGRDVSRRTTFFQTDYGLTMDGRVDRVVDTLVRFHDRAQLPELPPGRRAEPPTPPPGQPVPPLPPDVRPPSQGAVAMLQPSFPRGGLTVSSASGFTAHKLILFVQSELRLPRWFRDCLALGSKFRIEAHIALDSDAARTRENAALKQARKIDDVQIACLDAAIRAIQSDKWHISTGALREFFPELFPGPMFMATGIVPSDPPVNSGGLVPKAELSGEAVTMPTLAISTPSSRPSDYHVDPDNGGNAPGQRQPHRGFIWLSDRVQARNRRTKKLVAVNRSVVEVAEQFVHELACHADLINEGELHEATHPRHPPPTEADRRLTTIQTLLPSGKATEVTRAKLMKVAELPAPSTHPVEARAPA